MSTGTTTAADAQRERGVALETYRHLRMILIALPALMLVASIGMFLTQRSIQGSISAYYTGPLRDVFVGMLVGLAACLVAYRGAPLEDYALNMAGFYALFVAFVPLPAHLDALQGEAYDAAVAGIRLVTVSALKREGAGARTLTPLDVTSRIDSPRSMMPLGRNRNRPLIPWKPSGLVMLAAENLFPLSPLDRMMARLTAS